MRRVYKTAFILHVTACFLVPAGLGLEGLVLCVAEQGHVAIERPGHGCCGESDDHSSEAPASGKYLHEETAGHCGHCTDIPLPPGDTDPRIPLPHRPAHELISATPILAVAVVPEGRTCNEVRIDRDSSSLQKSLASLRTVVLLL